MIIGYGPGVMTIASENIPQGGAGYDAEKVGQIR